MKPIISHTINHVRQLKRRLVNRRYNKFVIFTEGRTGSTMLHTCLQRHTRILSHSEVFNLGLFTSDPERLEAIERDPIAYLYKYVFVDYAPIARAIGIKLLYSQCPGSDCPAFLQKLIDLDVRIVHLKRRDVLAMYVSGLVARGENRWHVLEGEQPEPLKQNSIVVSRDEFTDFAARYIAEVKRCNRFLSDVPHLEIYFEELSTNVDSELHRVVEFLGLRYEEGMRPMTKKRITQPLSEIVVNYSELEGLYLADGW